MSPIAFFQDQFSFLNRPYFCVACRSIAVCFVQQGFSSPHVTSQTDNLTAGLASGDADAIEHFYRSYFDYLYSLARRATDRDESFCLDVVQESVLRILRSVRPTDDEARFRAWLKLVVQTTAYDLLRAEHRRRTRERSRPDPAEPGGQSAASDAEQDRLNWLLRQIAAMDPMTARIINMRFAERSTLARISAAIGLSIGAIDGRLRRALAELKQRATERFNE